jgi:hypothetical protein
MGNTAEDQKHTVGEYYLPYEGEAVYVTYKLLEQVPDCGPAQMLTKISKGRAFDEYRQDVGKLIPFVIEFFNDKPRDTRTVCILWTLSCWWFQYEHGPKPDGTRKPKGKKVNTEDWRDKMTCAVCNMQAPMIRMKGEKTYILKLFGEWLVKHAEHCQSKVTMSTAMKKLHKIEQEQKSKEQQAAANMKWLLAQGDAGKQVADMIREMNRKQFELENNMTQEQLRQQDKNLFASTYRTICEALAQRSEIQERVAAKLAEEQKVRESRRAVINQQLETLTYSYRHSTSDTYKKQLQTKIKKLRDEYNKL